MNGGAGAGGRRVYLDYAATTPVDERVLAAMIPYLTEEYGNPSSLCSSGRAARSALEDARERIACEIGVATPSEFVFTGCGTESDVAAVAGIATAAASQGRGRHLVVSSYEHHAVLEPAGRLASRGFEVTLVDPRPDGCVWAEDVGAAVRKDTALVSVMHANNELGTVNDIAALARTAHAVGAFFHTDAAQSLGKIPFDAAGSGVDAATFAGHKIYAPKGVGGLYLKRGTPFEPLMTGGGQEFGLRSGTPNVAGAVALARALEIAAGEMDEESARLGALRERVFDAVLALGDARINGARGAARIPGIASVTIAGADGESLLAHLDEVGICVATGSACSSGSHQASHVLRAIGAEPAEGEGVLRVTVGRYTTAEDVGAFCEELARVAGRLRSTEAGGGVHTRSATEVT